MKTIAIELNHVVRNVNKQILKYYQKDINPELDIDNIDEKDDVFKYATFDSHRDRNEFVYIDYPYEIFGCAKPMDKNLPTKINNWLASLTNEEDETYKVIYYSFNEEALTIQSTYFFLSKIGTRVREVLFPYTPNEIIDRADVIITSNSSIIDHANGSYTKVILINRPTNKDVKDKAFLSYDSLTDLIDDKEFLIKLKKPLTFEPIMGKDMRISDLNTIINKDIPSLQGEDYAKWKGSFDVDIDTPHWRHYEMINDVGGIVAFYDGEKVIAKFFEGDDDNYWVDNLNLMLDSYWVKPYKEALERMYKWLEDNCEKEEFGYKDIKNNK